MPLLRLYGSSTIPSHFQFAIQYNYGQSGARAQSLHHTYISQQYAQYSQHYNMVELEAKSSSLTIDTKCTIMASPA